VQLCYVFFTSTVFRRKRPRRITALATSDFASSGAHRDAGLRGYNKPDELSFDLPPTTSRLRRLAMLFAKVK
jgi:hypothetical protein